MNSIKVMILIIIVIMGIELQLFEAAYADVDIGDATFGGIMNV